MACAVFICGAHFIIGERLRIVVRRKKESSQIVHKKSVFFNKIVVHCLCTLPRRTLRVRIISRGVPCWVSKHSKSRTVQSWRARIRTLEWHIDSSQYGSSGCVRVRLRSPKGLHWLFWTRIFDFLLKSFLLLFKMFYLKKEHKSRYMCGPSRPGTKTLDID